MKNLVIAALACAAVALPQPLRAATFTVNSTDDGVDTSPLGDGVCVTPAHTCTLRAAIMEANALAGADTIILAAGSYELRLPGTSEDQAWKGDLDITDDLVITGAGETATIIDGNHIDRVFDVHSPAQVTLSGLTITNGKPEVFGDGGGMLNAGTVTLNDVTFFRNRAGSSGGGGGGLKNLGTATLTHVTFRQNSAAGHVPNFYFDEGYGNGGGMWNVGTATLSDVTFRANHAKDASRGSYGYYGTQDGGYGGGLMNEGNVTLTDVTFILNRAGDAATDNLNGSNGGYGGGMENLQGTAVLTKVTFYRNRAGHGRSAAGFDGEVAGYGGDGGGFDNDYIATATFTDCSFIGNRAGRTGGPIGHGGYGGGIGNGFASTVTLTRVTLDRNHAGDSSEGGWGGGLSSTDLYSKEILTNVTVTRNRAGGGLFGGWGGGLNVNDGTLTNVTVAFNRAGGRSEVDGYSTAGIGNQIVGAATFTNTIIAGRKDNCELGYYSSGLISLGHNLDSGTNCGFHAATDLNNTNPKLGPLEQDNGGFTPTTALLPGSPAIDAGDNSACPATDQRGIARPQGAACDIGAYEFQPQP